MRGSYPVAGAEEGEGGEFSSLENKGRDADSTNNVRLRSYVNTGFEEDGNESLPHQKRETKLDDVSNGHVEGKKEHDEEPEERIEKVTIFEILRYAKKCDFVYFFVAVFAAICVGLGMPALIILFGDMMKDIITAETPNATNVSDVGAAFEDAMTETCQYMAYCGIAMFIMSYFQIAFMTMFGTSLVHRLRETSFRALVNQDIAWFDKQKTGALVTRLAEDMETIRTGISDKLALVIQYVTTFVSCLIVALVIQPKLAGILVLFTPILCLGGIFMSKISAGNMDSKSKEYAEAGFIAESTLSSIKTVSAFGGQHKALKEYEKQLQRAKKLEIRKMALTGFLIGFMHSFEFALYAFAYWYGAKLLVDGEIESDDMFKVVFCILMGSINLGQLVSTATYVFSVNSALTFVTSFIKRKPLIDSMGDEGLKPDSIQGHLEFEGVSFAYPTRRDITVLKNFSQTVKPGQSVALVGHSGSGKSTIVNLIQRFYEFKSGTITLDGVDIRKLNVKWLRSQIGVVSQEPVLFGCTIEENIKYGRSDVTSEEVMQAIEDANAKDFISKLPKGLNTLVGDRGSQLSGGQKQRIAIARALVRNPKILLLDEATSALDSSSESIVQEALDKACAGRTTIIIAHRLATIKHCDAIVTMDKGYVIEVGTHSELIKKHGAYAQLVKAQMLDEAESEKSSSERVRKRSELKEDDVAVDESVGGKGDSFENVDLAEIPEENVKSGKDRTSEEKKGEAGMLDVLKLNKPEWYLILASCLFSTPVGAGLAFYGILFAEVIDMFALPLDEIQDRANFLSLIFLVYAAGLCLSHVFQYGFLAFSGGRLTKRLRYQSFYTMLRQDMSFFDREENNVGELTTKLAQEASLVLGAGGMRLAAMCEFVASMTTAMVLAFIYGWQLTLFLFAFIPVIVVGSFIQTKAASGFQGEEDEKGNSGPKIISESVMNIKTVQSLHLESLFYQKYRDSLVLALRKMFCMSHVIGIAQSISQSMFFFVIAATFRFAAWLVSEGEIGPSDSLRVTFAILFGSYAVGQAMSVLPDYDKAKQAAHSIITLLKEQPLIDNLSTRGQRLEEEISEISFEDVHFSYPARKSAKILRGFSLTVERGTTVALVGPSGCGKSTVMQLLQRFYDPDSGTISINGIDISTLKLLSLRYKLAIVSQEPTLFNASISDNIRYGSLLSNGEFDPNITHDDVIRAAQQANIATFIESLPQGYDTNVGEKGTQLSGGQKQRVAIARAILRKPEILLLDEATSALDSESEKVVQQALDKVRQGRTCLVIAHRLNTIQNADKIVVIEQGTVVESGTHSELISQNGLYKEYCDAQSLKHD